MTTIPYTFRRRGDELATVTIRLDIFAVQIRKLIVDHRLLLARDIHNKLCAMHSSIATHPLVVELGAELSRVETSRRSA